MCIIAYRPENKTISLKTLEIMYENNPDGAGFMYADGGKIYLKKGFMTKDAFLNACADIPNDVPCVFHCRIATHGTVRQGTCHPFPCTSDPELLNSPEIIIKKGFAVAHNGIISGMNTKNDFSDSQAYIRDILAPLSKMRSLHSSSLLNTIEKTIDSSRLAVLGTDGKVSLFGKGWSVDDGIFYSNSSYKESRYSKSNTFRWDYKKHAYVNGYGKTWSEVYGEEDYGYSDYGTQKTLSAHGWGNSF